MPIMKKLLVIFIYTGCVKLSVGQNLVQNPSFETKSNCPYDTDQINFADGWSSYGLTPDYYNVCATWAAVSVPFNWSGYQLASNGNGYAGLFTRLGTYQAEYIGSQLIQPLVPGTKYYTSLKVNFPDEGYCCASSKIGVMFSNIPYSASNFPPITNNPHIYYPYVITDTASWTLVSGTFIADSAYQYIIIGNFFDYNNGDSIMLYNPTVFCSIGDSACHSYYFIDEICVSQDSLGCELNIGVDENSFLTNFKIFPNPTNQNAILEFDNPINEDCTLRVYDRYGLLVKSMNNIDGDFVNIKRENLPSGIYFFQLQTDRKIIAKGKLAFD